MTDKLGTPTYTVDFAKNLLALLDTDLNGLYHMACRGKATALTSPGNSSGPSAGMTSRSSASRRLLRRDLSGPSAAVRDERNLMLDLHDLNLMRPWQASLREYLERANALSDDGSARGR